MHLNIVQPICFTNNIGKAILEKSTGDRAYIVWTVSEIGRKVSVRFGIYIRQFLNMLYPFYPSQYIEDITKHKSLLLIGFYTLLFIDVFYFLRTFKLKDSKWIWFALILFSCVCILPGAVEIRFFIALHFVIYMYAVLGLQDFFMEFKRNKLKYSAMYLIGLLIYIAYAGMLLATTENGIATIN